MLRRNLRVLILVVVGVMLVALSVVLNQFRIRAQAEAFLSEFKSLSMGKSSFDEAKRLQATYGGRELTHGVYPSDCSPHECYIYFSFLNSWFARLHLAPPTGFGATLHIHDGVVSSRSVGYGAQAGDVSFDLSVDEGTSTGRNQGFCVVHRADQLGRPYKLMISMSAEAKPVQRELAYSFDLSCLARIGICGQPSMILPHLSEQNTVICDQSP